MLLILCVIHRFSVFNFKRLLYVCSVALWFCIVVNHLNVKKRCRTLPKC